MNNIFVSEPLSKDELRNPLAINKLRKELTLKLLPDFSSSIVLDADRPGGFTVNACILSYAVKNGEDLDYDVFAAGDVGYDAVVSFEVLEHLVNPGWYLKQAERALKVNGVLCLTTPIPLYPPSVFKYKRHFHEMSKKSLLDVLALTGFEVVKLTKIRRPLNKSIGVIKFIRWVFGSWWYVEAIKGDISDLVEEID